nr:hypothetical protein BaRGS_009297 [Batillaria attramentaria]
MGNVSEDCLHLNVYVPRTDQQASLPVIVWIHGGAFVSGEARDIPGEILAAFGGVIVVTVNFRLGALGFLATDDETAPGNFGLWDQRLALQWVKTHIEHFGGDSGRITLAGTLSGGICVTFQALYPPNGRLFQRIIPETGTAIGVAGYHVRGPIAASVNESLTSGTSDQLFEKIVQAMLPRVDVEELGEVQEQAVLQEYKHWEDPESPRDNDHGFFIPSVVFTRNHAAGNSSGNTFMYEFNQRGNTPLPYPWLEGSLHGDHNAFVFGLPERDEESTMTQLNFTRRVMTYWSNFVKTGNPNTPASQDVEWPPFTVDDESGFVWCAVVRCGAVRCGAVRCGAVQCGAVRGVV